MSKVAIIIGAPNEQSRLNGLVQYTLDLLTINDISYEIIKVFELPAEDLLFANFQSEAIKQTNKVIEEADGVLIFTPVYKAAYSGILKTFLDLLPQKGLENKVVLPLVIGGSFGHLLSIEYALNPVLSALGATHIMKGVYTIDKEVERVNHNQFELKQEVRTRLSDSVGKFKQVLNV